ncbi:fumarylacetoacetate hydrolase family protein [Bacillus horti]|uniref:2-keto-4-pentenoate hydratase/2-oxohepta-3-ene-1,7-dioic acid hydratase in catechol pathway n=1 Tax=Caldalkalibacillus horti TaxID=77523 RepID=A0ABT9W3S3_9BACI|nr:fumarylacetoacetate hydrolase family protein [Bacillus horti]MDQ0167908.1 2-keto-4-pentenoate hydratase/2-oxohepta-3-ene-1,7-dioic acid hydratase in catechol pathway [Bacillus horti]
MKLVTFSLNNSKMEQFGIVIDDYVISFERLRYHSNLFTPLLNNINSYLQGLPESEQDARKLHAHAQEMISENNIESFLKLEQVQLLSPIPNPPAVLDFGLSPKHLLNSGYTLIEHEFKGILKPILRKVLDKALRKTIQKSSMPYYKCNHLSINGPFDTLVWPSYTSYLDIEPELGVVIGNSEVDPSTGKNSTSIAGYVIMNDVSARDVQFPDFRLLCGPAKSKDFDKSIGIGPYFVTSDEVENPLSLDVRVEIDKNNRLSWQGSTSEYISHPQEVVDYLSRIFTPPPGTIIGMGTIPGCCGLDNNQWLLPGDEIEISIKGLGTLKQFVPNELKALQSSRWKNREELKAYYKQWGSE